MVACEGRVYRLVEITWGEGVDAQALRPPVGRHAFGQVGDRFFGHRAGRDGRSGEGGLDRGYVDDPPGAAFDHVAGDCLCRVKDAWDVGLQQQFEILGRQILQRCAALDPGVVHQN